MSSVVANNPPRRTLPQVRAAIPVKVGDIDITATLDVDCAVNAIHRRLLKRIFQQGNDHRKYEDVENVKLDLTIDGRLVALKFHVFSDLYTDMALGEEFFSSVQAHIDVELGLFKWSYQELVTTKMVDDSHCDTLPHQVRAAILVKVGDIDITAVLDVDCAINAVHRRVFKRICQQDNDYRKYEDVENVELDLTIDDRLVLVKFHVFNDLYADMILGNEFFTSVKAHVDLELRLLKWSCQNDSVITEMLKDDCEFRALSGGSDATNTNTTKETSSEEVIAKASNLPQVENTTAQNNVPTKQKRKKKSKKAKSEQSSDSTSTVEDLQNLHISNSNSSSKSNKKEVVKIFIADRELWDMSSGECLAYYGIYCPQKNIKVIKGEVLERKEKTPLGYYMEALHETFGEADKHGIEHLHIVSENKDAVKLMIAHQKRYEKDGDMDPLEPEELLRSGAQLFYADDFINYNTACYGIPGYESIKFEYVHFEDERYPEMVHIRELVAKYIEDTPM